MGTLGGDGSNGSNPYAGALGAMSSLSGQVAAGAGNPYTKQNLGSDGKIPQAPEIPITQQAGGANVQNVSALKDLLYGKAGSSLGGQAVDEGALGANSGLNDYTRMAGLFG